MALQGWDETGMLNRGLYRWRMQWCCSGIVVISLFYVMVVVALSEVGELRTN